MHCGQIITLSCGGTDSDFFGRILLMDNISAVVLYPPNPNLQHLNTRRKFRFRESSLAPKDKRDAIHRNDELRPCEIDSSSGIRISQGCNHGVWEGGYKQEETVEQGGSRAPELSGDVARTERGNKLSPQPNDGRTRGIHYQADTIWGSEIWREKGVLKYFPP